MIGVCQRAILTASLLALLLVLPAQAQLRVGENTSMNLNGNLSFGYNGDYSNVNASDHSMSPGGNADLNGFYYNPNFLAFDVQPFYDQSRANSNYQSVFQSGGVNGSASIFSGSNFPGSISYSKVYNSSGGLLIPGVGNLTTRGDSGNLGVGWGIHIPDYPNFSLQFADGDSANSVFGTSAKSSFHSDAFGLHASEMLAGFNLNGGYQYDRIHALTPEFLAGEAPTTSSSSSNTFNFGAGHSLPMHGSASTSFSRSDVSAEDSSGNGFKGTIDTVSSGAGFQPIRNLDVGVNTQYTNNLTGMLYQPLISSGVAVPASLLNYSTDSLDINSHASYALPALHLTFMANADRREQTVLGTSLSADTFNETVTYGSDLLGGFINAVAGVTETTVNVAHSSSYLGQFESVSYLRTIGGWNVNGSFNYARNTQTVLIGYTTSGYGYSAGLGRKINAYTYWSVNAVETKSTFNNVPGSGNSSQSYSMSLSLKLLSMSGSYNKSDGTSFLTPTGLTPITNPVPVTTQALLFSGKSYSFGASTTPRRGLVLSANYSDARSNTEENAAASKNTTRLLNGMLQYKVRQLWITGGYLRLQQGFSITGQPAASYSSFYVGITRWFKFF